MDVRPAFHEYFLDLARAVAARGDCSRRQVGCVLVNLDQRIIATGYNGTLPGAKGCLAGGCPRATLDVPPGVDYELTACIALHAEMNAVAYASFDATKGSSAYITDAPCYMCQKVLAAAGVRMAFWPHGQLTLAL